MRKPRPNDQFCVREHAQNLHNLRDLRFPHWQSAGGSRPLIGSNRRNRRFSLRCGPTFLSFQAFKRQSAKFPHLTMGEGYGIVWAFSEAVSTHPRV